MSHTHELVDLVKLYDVWGLDDADLLWWVAQGYRVLYDKSDFKEGRAVLIKLVPIEEIAVLESKAREEGRTNGRMQGRFEGILEMRKKLLGLPMHRKLFNNF